MQVKVENTSTIERRLTVLVPAEAVETAYQQQVTSIAKKAKIKGFRQGKVPKNYVEQHFGSDARRDALSEVINDSLSKALVQENIQPIAVPRVEPKNIKPGEPLEFVATLEIMPVIEAVNFKLDTVEKLVVEVTDEDVNRVIEQLRKQYTKWHLVERAAALKDRVVIDFDVVMNGEPLKDQAVTAYPLELGAEVMIPGFESGLVGAKAGDTRQLTLNFPVDYHNKALADKPAQFNVTVNQVFESEAPALDEAFIKQLGIKDGQLSVLKEQIMQSLTQERDRLVKDNLKTQVYNALMAQNAVDVPASMIANEAKNIHDEMYPDHEHKGQHDHSAKEMATFREIAKKRVALGLIITAYTKNEQLKINDELVTKRLKEIASIYENPAEVETWLSTSDRLGGIQAQVMEDQVLDKLLESVNLTEKTITYAELKGIRV